MKWYFYFNLAFFSGSHQFLSSFRKIEQIEFKLENSGFMCWFPLYFPTWAIHEDKFDFPALPAWRLKLLLMFKLNVIINNQLAVKWAQQASAFKRQKQRVLGKWLIQFDFWKPRIPKEPKSNLQTQLTPLRHLTCSQVAADVGQSNTTGGGVTSTLTWTTYKAHHILQTVGGSDVQVLVRYWKHEAHRVFSNFHVLKNSWNQQISSEQTMRTKEIFPTQVKAVVWYFSNKHKHWSPMNIPALLQQQDI